MKRSAADSRYLDARKALSQKMGPQELWSVVDQWPLFVGIQNLGRYLALYETLKNCPSVPGHVAEFGTWNGASTMLMAKTMQIIQPNVHRRYLCFDTFSGLPAGAENDGAHNASGGGYNGNLERFEDFIKLYEFDHSVEIHKGLIEDTLPAALAADASLMFSFVFCDADLYEPTKVALEHCHDRLVNGGCIVFDEWAHPDWPGETQAVQEFLAKHPGKYRESTMSQSRQPSLLIRKIG